MCYYVYVYVIFRAEIWWTYLEADGVFAPPPFTFLDLFERVVSHMKLEWKYKAFCRDQEEKQVRREISEKGDQQSSSGKSSYITTGPTELQVQIDHELAIKKEFLTKYKQLLLMLLAQLENYSAFDNNSVLQNANIAPKVEAELMGGCEAVD